MMKIPGLLSFILPLHFPEDQCTHIRTARQLLPTITLDQLQQVEGSKKAILNHLLRQQFNKGINRSTLLDALERFIDKNYGFHYDPDITIVIKGSELAKFIKSPTPPQKEEQSNGQNYQYREYKKPTTIEFE